MPFGAHGHGVHQPLISLCSSRGPLSFSPHLPCIRPVDAQFVCWLVACLDNVYKNERSRRKWKLLGYKSDVKFSFKIMSGSKEEFIVKVDGCYWLRIFKVEEGAKTIQDQQDNHLLFSFSISTKLKPAKTVPR